jgi:HD-GYP domain-containing protein (c-di-GMP phosphodiesterase class II)
MQNTRFHPLKSAHSSLDGSLHEHLHSVHAAIAARFPAVERLALASYDPATDMLKTFVSSNLDDVRLEHYAAQLATVPSLKALADNRQSRVVDDIALEFPAATEHTFWLKQRDYCSSLTVPIFRSDKLVAFLFFDSKKKAAFDHATCNFLEVFADLISQMHVLQLQVVNGMVGSVHIANALARTRDLETGRHLDRMAAYARLMAQALARPLNLHDEFVEYVFMFAPLHDVGKVGIPDTVLLKPGKLDADELRVMQRHVEIGLDIVEQMCREIGLVGGLAWDVMHNIVASHHERGDGSGYPQGLTMEQIPLEARIVAVADVYDALSNTRPYKHPWVEAEIVAELRSEVHLGRLDARCVQALLEARAEREAIQQRFADL